MEKAFLIDGNSFCYRAFYAIKNLRTSYGKPTNAIYGFVTMLNALLAKESPDYLALSFDMKEPTFRHKAFIDYKVHRKPMPDELVLQLPYIRQIADAYHISVFEKEGFEADDCLATLAKNIASDKITVYIVTGDKDILQLVNSHIKVYNIHKEGVIYDEGKVRERFKVEPKQIPDIIALMGDASDNLPGVKGIGERGAVELIAEFGSLENLLSDVDRVKNKAQRYALKQYKQDALLSKELAVLDMGVPLHNMSPDELKLKAPDNSRLAELFRELEFKSLLKEILKNDPKEIDNASFKVLKDTKEFNNFVKILKDGRWFALDISTDTDISMSAKIKELIFYLPDGGIYRIEQNRAFIFKEILEDDTVGKFGHNMKFKKVVLKNHGIELRGIAFDTMLASYLVNSKGWDIDTYTDIFQVKAQLEKELEEKSLRRLFEDIEMPLICVLADMEFRGIGIDLELLKDMSAELEGQIKALHKDIIEVAGCDFNINSPKQLAEVLFKRLKLPVFKRTKTGPSTDSEVLQHLAAQHSLPKMILNYREIAKLKSTYVDAFPALVLETDKRLHTSFNQAVTATGRLSSSEPNLQNIPIRTELGRRMRKAFIAIGRDSVLLSADYSQIELRILAHLSKDDNLICAFKEGADIHRFTASLIYGVAPESVTPDMRALGKTVNFAVIYGMGEYGLSKELNIDQQAAQSFISSYFARYPKVRQYIDSEVQRAEETGFVTTIFGRRRYIPDINSTNSALRSFAQRTAVNAPIQGSAADIIKLAMVKIYQALKDEDMKTAMVLQIHDELLFEVPKKELDTAKRLICHHMQGAAELCVPLEVSVKTGANWLELC